MPRLITRLLLGSALVMALIAGRGVAQTAATSGAPRRPAQQPSAPSGWPKSNSGWRTRKPPATTPGC